MDLKELGLDIARGSRNRARVKIGPQIRFILIAILIHSSENMISMILMMRIGAITKYE